MSNNEDRSAPNGSDESNLYWVRDPDRASPPLPGPDTILSIENVARMFNVGQLTLRYYEARGMIKRRHRIGRTRVYSWADCNRVAFITKVRRAGLKLGEFALLIKIKDNVLGDRERGRKMCTRLIERLARRRRAVDDGLAELRYLHMLLSAESTGQENVAHRR